MLMSIVASTDAKPPGETAIMVLRRGTRRKTSLNMPGDCCTGLLHAVALLCNIHATKFFASVLGAVSKRLQQLGTFDAEPRSPLSLVPSEQQQR